MAHYCDHAVYVRYFTSHPQRWNANRAGDEVSNRANLVGFPVALRVFFLSSSDILYVPADPLRSSARSSLARRVQQLLFDLLLNRTIEVNAILFEMPFVVASICIKCILHHLDSLHPYIFF